MVTTFNSLPNEVQQMVFGNIDDTLDICDCILVTKSWSHFFQQLLYSDVCFDDFSKLTQFLYTLESNDNLRSLVKSLSIFYDEEYTEDEQSSIVAKVFKYLPNLEFLDCSIGVFYKVLLEALLNNQLPRLKNLHPPNPDVDIEENDSYIACTILLKNRLERLTIKDSLEENEEFFRNTENYTIEDSIRFYRLFDLLEEFKNIRYLHITKKTNNIIGLIEKATHRCPLLNHLEVKFTINNEVIENSVDVDDAMITNSSPALKISCLTINGDVFNTPYLAHYITHKFPEVNNLKIDTREAKTPYLNDYTLNQSFNYLKIPEFTKISLRPINGQCVVDLIEMFWRDICQSFVLLTLNTVDTI